MRAGGRYVDRFHAMVRIVEELGHDALSELSTTVEWAPGLASLTAGADGRTLASREGPAVGDDHIYRRDMQWLGKADALVAEVSAPSLGVGYEISHALHVCKILVLCLVHVEVKNLSAMIAGNTSPGLRLARYSIESDMRKAIERFMRDVPMP
jgi:hypothetical protein